LEIAFRGAFPPYEVRLLPVEFMQPKLDENLEAVTDESGDNELEKVDELRFCRWRDAFEGTDIWRTGERTFKKNFIDEDRDRVVVRIPGEVADGESLKAFVKTETDTGIEDDDETEVTFTKNADGDFEYTMILVTSKMEDGYDPSHSEPTSQAEFGVPGAGHYMKVSDDESGDTTHRAAIGGSVSIRFPDLSDLVVSHPMMQFDQVVKVKVFYLIPPGDNTAAWSSIVSEDFREAHEIYAQMGITLEIIPAPISLTQSQLDAIYGQGVAEEDRNFQITVSGSAVGAQVGELFEICDIPVQRVTVPTLFYMPSKLNYRLSGHDFGFSITRDSSAATGCGFVSFLFRDYNTFSHELGHLLGLADNPGAHSTSDGQQLKTHHHYNAWHLLLAISSEYVDDNPIDTGRRFTVREEKWLKKPRADRTPNGDFDSAKSFIKPYAP